MSSAFRRLAPLALVLLAGCAGDDAQPATTAPTHGPEARGAPALLRAPERPGELLLSGEASPATHGPETLRGRYEVRFAQYAPEDPTLDFGEQTAFVATLRQGPAGPRQRTVRLFRAAARSGVRTLDLDGRYAVEVAFGDFPWVLRFTPLD
jgi:hypothetical protein